ncbi:MAG: hypothetical protein J5I90_18310 [Caldilineales bacterium]|nr:hypothetical protein [Caldilineales bacterium]
MHFVIVGHITRDITPTGYALGGTVSYAAVTAQRMGAQVTIVTRSQVEDAAHPALHEIELINIPSAYTTTFQNLYEKGVRTQYVRAVAEPIFAADWPQKLNGADVTLLAPLVQEVDPAVATLANGLIAATPQGWMREWDAKGRVRPVPWYSAGRILPHLDVLIMSAADLGGDERILENALQSVPIVIMTESADGCVVFERGNPTPIPPRVSNEVDPTGAGDVFAAAFLVHFHDSGDVIRSAYFANVAASFSIEGAGLAAIPNRDLVETYINAHPI